MARVTAMKALETKIEKAQAVVSKKKKEYDAAIAVAPEQPKYSMRFFSDDNASDNLAARKVDALGAVEAQTEVVVLPAESEDGNLYNLL